jgi:RNA polymerase sigma-70 factor, ECF subfamily
MLASPAMGRHGSGDGGAGVFDRTAEAGASRLHARGQARHPRIHLSRSVLAAHLERCGASLEAEIDGDRAGDLYLACAALAGDPEAVATFQKSCWPAVAAYLKPFAGGKAFLAEVAQELWEALLVGSAGRAPRLRDYTGRGPLGAFVGIAAQRIALMSVRRDEARARTAARAGAERDGIVADAELAYIKQRYRGAFEACIEKALAELDDHSRMILRLYFADGVGLERLGRIYGVAASTISRRLRRARGQVSGRTRQLLGARLRLTPDEAESLWNVVASQIDLSVSRLFREQPMAS